MTATDTEENRKLSPVKVERYLKQKVDISRRTTITEKQGYIIGTENHAQGEALVAVLNIDSEKGKLQPPWIVKLV